MHSAGSDRAVSQTAVTQAQADTCCALSERSPSTPSSSSHVVAFTLIDISTLVSIPLPETVPLRDSWRAVVPIAVSPVPRHVLLSVFLV
jgi:hypothetical protein